MIMGPERGLGQSMISCVVGTCVAETRALCLYFLCCTFYQQPDKWPIRVYILRILARKNMLTYFEVLQLYVVITLLVMLWAHAFPIYVICIFELALCTNKCMLWLDVCFPCLGIA